jgi:CotH kinase protein/Chitobiase/beta-hexosaminidase C-terminal domain
MRIEGRKERGFAHHRCWRRFQDGPRREDGLADFRSNPFPFPRVSSSLPQMPLSRSHSIPSLVMLGSLLSCGLLLRPIPSPAEAEPTAKANGKLLPLEASTPRGLCDAPFSLTLTTPSDDAVIRYTLDGTEPTPKNGDTYSVPLKISKTTLLRAAAFKERTRVSAVATYSYLFVDQILHQPKDPPGFPSGPQAWSGMPSAYQMDAGVVNDPAYRDRMRDAFKSLPIVSLVCPRDELFGRGGLYLNTAQRGDAWEKSCSAEMILPDGGTAFQIDCGLRIQGGMNRHNSPKHSFRLVFKEKYGAGKLRYALFPDSPVKKFDTLVLRADYNNSWVHWDGAARLRAQRTRDAWMKDSHRAMGWVAAHNRYVHLFLHGLYWGIYDFTERPDANFAAAYLGGTREDYDVVNEFQAKDGTLDQFNLMHSLTGLAHEKPYQKLQEVLDVTNFIDYVLLNYYAGNQDWGEQKNWYAIHRRQPDARFQYFVWDGEQLLHGVRDNTVSNPEVMPFRMMEELKGNAEFREAFAARVKKHLFGDGALTPAACADRWRQRAKEVDLAIIAESARWGYYRRNPPFTRDQDWAAEQQRLLKEYFPQRTEIVLQQLQAAGLYPKNADLGATR